MLYNSSGKLENTNSINILSEHQLNNNIIAKGDSAASKHYWKESHRSVLSHVRPYSGPSVTLPDADMIAPSNKGILSLSSQLSNEAQTATTLPQLQSSSLISLGQICDDACTIILDKNKLIAVKDTNIKCKYNKNEIILEGTRNVIDGLWDIPVAKRNITADNYVVPSLHGLSSNNHKNIKRNNMIKNNQRDTHIVSKNTNIFKNFEGLIDTNVCNYIVNRQIKKDRIARQTTRFLDKHLNVISHKYEINEDLADFLHGSCFSPVISTF